MIIWWDDVTISYSMRNKWLMFFFKNFPNALLFRTLLLLLLRTSFCDILNNLRLMRAQGLLDFGRFFFARSWKPWEQKQHLTNLTICCRNTWIRSEWYYSIICSDTIKRSRLKSCHLPSLLLSFDRSVVLRNLIWKKICTLLPTNIFYMICKIIIFQFRP